MLLVELVESARSGIRELTRLKYESRTDLYVARVAVWLDSLTRRANKRTYDECSSAAYRIKRAELEAHCVEKSMKGTKAEWVNEFDGQPAAQCDCRRSRTTTGDFSRHMRHHERAPSWSRNLATESVRKRLLLFVLTRYLKHGWFSASTIPDLFIFLRQDYVPARLLSTNLRHASSSCK